MGLLFNLIKEENKTAQAGWNLLFRLPLYSSYEENRSRFELRYWLYKQDLAEKSELDS
jgi:hypothetical protein